MEKKRVKNIKERVENLNIEQASSLILYGWGFWCCGASTLIWTEKLRSRRLDLKQMRSQKHDEAGTPYLHARI
jgi:hypothetical protein